MEIPKILMLMAATTGIQAAAGSTLHVCSECAYRTIQQGVDAAVSGDTIAIAAGRYVENVVIEGKHLILQGEVTSGAPVVTEVYGASRGPVFTLGSARPGDTPELTEIHGLTISHGNHTGGTGQGGGIQVRAGAYLHLYDSVITRNYALSGAGISISTPGAPENLISGCIIAENRTPTTVKGRDYVGGGVGVFAGSRVSVRATTIVRNLSNDGGGLFADSGTHVVVDGSTFSENSAQPSSGSLGPGGGGGGGLESYGSVSISNSSFVNNLGVGPSGGGALFFVMTAADTHVISNTIVARNNDVSGSSETAEGPGGGIAAYGSGVGPHPILTIKSSYVVHNLAEGGIWYDSNSSILSLQATTVSGNGGGQICNNVSPCTP